MDRGIYGLRLMAEQFHDIDFAAARPAAVTIVRRQHPDGRSDSLSLRQLGTDVESSLEPVTFAFGADAPEVYSRVPSGPV